MGRPGGFGHPTNDRKNAPVDQPGRRVAAATESGDWGTYSQEVVAHPLGGSPLKWLLSFAAARCGELVPGAARADEHEGRSFAVSALLYLPNRLLDLGDLFRFGVDAGPGLGFDLQATRLVQVKLLSRFSVGVGYQTLRHLPVKASADAAFGVGPIGGSPAGGLGWYRSPTRRPRRAAPARSSARTSPSTRSSGSTSRSGSSGSIRRTTTCDAAQRHPARAPDGGLHPAAVCR